MNWYDEAIKNAKTGESAVLVTVADISGSSPREVGAKMLVMADKCVGTIGGGALELDATKMARTSIEEMKTTQLKDYPLGPSLGQCCGGFVRLIFEPINKNALKWLQAWGKAKGQQSATIFKTTIGEAGDKTMVAGADNKPKLGLIDNGDETIFVEKVCDEKPNLWIFGAGHVGMAIVTALQPLDFAITLVDSRQEFLNEKSATLKHNENPAAEVGNMPSGATALIMTHSHAQDFDISHACLTRGDLAFVGLIGSGTKKARFIKRLREKGVAENTITTLTCPIGIGQIRDKKPAAIAISVVAQLLTIVSEQANKTNDLDNIDIAN